MSRQPSSKIYQQSSVNGKTGNKFINDAGESKRLATSRISSTLITENFLDDTDQKIVKQVQKKTRKNVVEAPVEKNGHRRTESASSNVSRFKGILKNKDHVIDFQDEDVDTEENGTKSPNSRP